MIVNTNSHHLVFYDGTFLFYLYLSEIPYSFAPMDERTKMIRYNNVLRLVEEYGTNGRLEKALGMSGRGNYVSAIRRQEKQLSEKSARKWEKLLRLPRLWLDQEHDVEKEFDFLIDPAGAEDVHIYASVVAAANAQVRARGLNLSLEEFQRIVNAAYQHLTQNPRSPEEAVNHVLDIALLLRAA